MQDQTMSKSARIHSPPIARSSRNRVDCERTLAWRRVEGEAKNARRRHIDQAIRPADIRNVDPKATVCATSAAAAAAAAARRGQGRWSSIVPRRLDLLSGETVFHRIDCFDVSNDAPQIRGGVGRDDIRQVLLDGRIWLQNIIGPEEPMERRVCHRNLGSETRPQEVRYRSTSAKIVVVLERTRLHTRE